MIQNDMISSIRQMLSPLPWLQILLHAIILLLALIMGRIAVTANAIYIAMAVGMIAGSFLLIKPKVLMAAILVLGLLVTGILPLWLPGMARLSWAVSLLGFLLWGIALMTRVLQLSRDKKTVPAYVYIALTFFIYSLLISLAQWYSAGELFSAVKRFFQAWGIMFAFAWLVILPLDIQRLQKFILFVALVQLPFALYELIKFVPLRETLVASSPGLIPIDIVVGTFEGNLYGGGSNAEMVTFQIMVFAFLLSRWREKLITAQRTLLLSCFILAPLFLGETKIVVILLPMMFFGLYGAELFRNPVKGIIAILAGLLITFLAGYVYVEFVIGQSLQDVIDDTLRYNVYNVGYGNNLLNRTSVLTHWWQSNAADVAHLLMGHGLGSAHSGGAGLPGHIAKIYPGYGINLTAGAQVLWETGLIGLTLFMMIFIFAWQRCNILMKNTSERLYQADLAAIRAILPIFILFLFYRSSLSENMGFQIIFSLVLGYLAVLSHLIAFTPALLRKQEV